MLWWTRRELVRVLVIERTVVQQLPEALCVGATITHAFSPETEGITWARGWDGPAVDALRAAVGLA